MTGFVPTARQQNANRSKSGVPRSSRCFWTNGTVVFLEPVRNNLQLVDQTGNNLSTLFLEPLLDKVIEIDSSLFSLSRDVLYVVEKMLLAVVPYWCFARPVIHGSFQSALLGI